MIEMLRMRAGFAGGSDEDHAAHGRLADAVADRDVDAASTLTRSHLEALSAALE
jgi:DNA-binding GntR family transcriptional regulator